MLRAQGSSIKGKICSISGSGNVAQYSEKIVQLGGKVITFSDSGGTVYDPNGFDLEKIAKFKS